MKKHFIINNIIQGIGNFIVNLILFYMLGYTGYNLLLITFVMHFTAGFVKGAVSKIIRYRNSINFNVEPPQPFGEQPKPKWEPIFVLQLINTVDYKGEPRLPKTYSKRYLEGNENGSLYMLGDAFEITSNISTAAKFTFEQTVDMTLKKHGALKIAKFICINDEAFK